MESYEGFILIGGNDYSKKILTTCEVYNQDFDIPPLPLPLSGHITEVVEATGSIIVAGGQTGKISDKTFLLPSLSSKTWKEMGRMAEPVYCAASATIGDNLLVIGGITDNRDKNILVTDKIQMLKLTDANPTWAVLQNKYWPKRLGDPRCVVWNESLILLTSDGVTYSTPLNKLIDTSEALQDTDWDKSELPGVEYGGPPRFDFGPSIAVVNEDVVAVLGGQVWRKTEGGEWKQLSSLPEEKHCWPSIGTRNNRLYIAGGAVGIGSVTSASASVFELDKSTNSWEEAPPLKQPRCFHSTVKLPPGTLQQNQNPLNIIKSLLGTLHLYTNITDETRQYIRKRAITSIDSMEKLKEQRTGRLEPRLSLLILFAALLTETELGEDLKHFLEIDPTVFEQFNPETVKAYIGTVKLSKPTRDVETTHKLITPEAPETTLYISGLQGSGKTSLGLSMKDKIMLSENIKCEGKTRENTQLMDQYQVPLRMKTKLKIDVEQYITEDANELPTNLSILKINPTEQAGDIQSSTIPTEGIQMSNRSSNILTSEIAVNVIDIGGHEEYAVVTKSLFKNESVYLVNFDGSKYTEKTYRRHIGSFLETIVVESSGAAIALVSNKCDAGKQTYTKDEENRGKILQEAKKDLAHWCNKLDKRAYLFDKIFVVSCAPNKTLPLLKDVTRCCKRNISPNKGIEDLKECLAKLYLDTTDTTIGKEGEKVIPVEMAPLSFYREFHNKMKEEEKQNKFDDSGSEYWLEPIKLDKAKQIFKLLESEKLRELKNKEISEENLELDWMIQAINGLPMESERIETQENDSFTSNQDTDNGNTSCTGNQDVDNLISTSNSPNPSTPSLTTQSTVVPSVKNMSPGQGDKKEEFPEGESSESPNKSFELAIRHLQNAGKLIILDKEFRPENYVFPDPMKLINSFKILVNHTLNDKLKPQDNEIWKFNEDIHLDERQKFRSMILNNGFMVETVVDLLFKCEDSKNHHLFHQDVVKQLLSKLCLTCKWEFEGWDGWLIPSLLRKSLNECKKWAKLDYMGFGELEYLRANIVEKSIETPLVGVGFGHRMMIHILKNESVSPFGSLKVGEMAIQPLERRDPGDIFLFIGCHPKNDIQIVLIEEERNLPDEKEENYRPHVRVLKMFVKYDSNKEILQKKFISLQKALNETLNPFKSTSERNEMNEAGQNNEDNELEHVIKVTPQNNIMRIISNGKKHLWTDYIKTETLGQDDRVGERMFNGLPDRRPPTDEGEGFELCKTLAKSLFTIVGIVFSCLVIYDLSTNEQVQKGTYPYIWKVLLTILYAPFLPNVLILFQTVEDLKNLKKWALVLLHLTGPFIPVIATCLWLFNIRLFNKKSNELWLFKIKTGINYGIWESFFKLLFSSFIYSFGIIPLSPLELEDADGNKITLPATAFTMTVISVLTLIYSVYDSWTTYPPHDGLRRDDDGGENNDTEPLLDAHLELETGQSNQLKWYKKYLFVSMFFSILLTIFRVLGIFAVTIYLSWWYYIGGLLASFVVYLILFVLFGPLCKEIKSFGINLHPKMQYSLTDWIWIFFLLVPVPTPAFSKRVTHTFFLFHNLFTNTILLILLYFIPYKVFSDKTHIMSDQLIIPNYLIISCLVTCAILMPCVTGWHYWITWAHTHRRILPRLPCEKDKDANCIWLPCRRVFIYLGCIFILVLPSGLIIRTWFCATQDCVTDRCYTPGVPCYFDDYQLEVKRDSNGQLSPHDTSALYNWENNTIPFYFTSTSEKDKKLFQSVMARIEGKTCFKFEEKTKVEDTDVHILEIETLQKSCTSGCRGLVGSDPFSKKIQLTSWTQVSDSEDCKLQCEGFVLHELMHVLGVGHAHRRSDRDDFITVNEANVMSFGLTDQFKKCEKCTIFSDIPYDCNSITHFGTHFLNSNDTKLMKPKNPNTCTLKQDANFNDGMEGSVLDWKLLNIIGNC